MPPRRFPETRPPVRKSSFRIPKSDPPVRERGFRKAKGRLPAWKSPFEIPRRSPPAREGGFRLSKRWPSRVEDEFQGTERPPSRVEVGFWLSSKWPSRAGGRVLGRLVPPGTRGRVRFELPKTGLPAGRTCFREPKNLRTTGGDGLGFPQSDLPVREGGFEEDSQPRNARGGASPSENESPCAGPAGGPRSVRISSADDRQARSAAHYVGGCNPRLLADKSDDHRDGRAAPCADLSSRCGEV